MVSPFVKWKSTRWPIAVLRRLEFYQFLRDCRRTNLAWIEKVPQHALGYSVLYHTLCENPAILLNSKLSSAQAVMAG